MKQFKEKLKRNIIIDAICCIILLALTIFTYDPEVGFTVGSGFCSWGALTSGVCAGMLVVYGINMVRGLLALRSEEKMKKKLVQENDERSNKIWSSARSTASRLTLGLGVSACVLAGYFNMVIALTILGCLAAHSLLVLLMVLIYNKKY